MIRQCFRKARINLRVQSRQVPCFEVLPRSLRRLSPPRELPAVLLEILPIPVRENCLHHRLHLRRCLRELRLHACDFFLRFRSLNLRLKHNLPRDGLDGFGPRFVGYCASGDDAQFFDRGFRQAAVSGFLGLFPESVAGRRE